MKQFPSFEQRVQFYLGGGKDTPLNAGQKKTISDLTEHQNTHDLVYDVPLKKLLFKTGHQDRKFHFTRGDIIQQHEQNPWTLCKNRCDGNDNSVLLRCFNFDRHWKSYYQKPHDIPFMQKSNAVFWRGISTGASNHFSSQYWSPRPVNRFVLVERWFGKNPNIHVGFSRIHREWLKAKYQKYVRGFCRQTEFLRYKYILSVEGNDKDSGLNWKLNSNSVVMMPKPRVTSWLMESMLVAGYHYVLLKDDFSDLEDKLRWCNANQSACKQIVANANAFMAQFADRAREERLEIEVLKRYFELLI